MLLRVRKKRDTWKSVRGRGINLHKLFIFPPKSCFVVLLNFAVQKQKKIFFWTKSLIWVHYFCKNGKKNSAWKTRKEGSSGKTQQMSCNIVLLLFCVFWYVVFPEMQSNRYVLKNWFCELESKTIKISVNRQGWGKNESWNRVKSLSINLRLPKMSRNFMENWSGKAEAWLVSLNRWRRNFATSAGIPAS